MDSDEAYEDAEGDRGFLPDLGPPAATHVELPIARARREALGGGGDVGGPCVVCQLPDADGDRPALARWRRSLAEQPRLLPEEEACRLLSSVFNRSVASGLARPSVTLSPSQVQAHLEHSLHLQSEEDRLLDDCVWYALKARRQIERCGLWFEGPDGSATVDPDGFERWQKTLGTLVRALEVRRRLRDGVTKRRDRPDRRRSTHYAPSRVSA